MFLGGRSDSRILELGGFRRHLRPMPFLFQVKKNQTVKNTSIGGKLSFAYNKADQSCGYV